MKLADMETSLIELKNAIAPPPSRGYPHITVLLMKSPHILTFSDEVETQIAPPPVRSVSHIAVLSINVEFILTLVILLEK